LRIVLAHARTGGSVLPPVGEPGAGKSALVSEPERRLHQTTIFARAGPCWKPISRFRGLYAELLPMCEKVGIALIGAFAIWAI
jgi:hypothetical protein